MTYREASPAFQWYARDILASPFVTALTPEQENSYRRLLDYQWVGGSIPNTPEALAPLCKLTVAKMDKVWRVIAVKFVPLAGEPGRLINVRLEEERAIQADWREKSKKGGTRSAEVRRLAREKLLGNAPVIPRVVEPPLQNGCNQNATNPQLRVRSPGSGPESVSDKTASQGATPAPEPPREPKKKPGRKPSGPIQELLSWFKAEYERTQGSPYVIKARDAANLKANLEAYGADELRVRLGRGLIVDDAFLNVTARDLALLLSCINKPSLRGIAPQHNDRIGRSEPSRKEDFRGGPVEI